MKNKLIVALDVDSVYEAQKLTSVLRDDVSCYKIGLSLQLKYGLSSFIEGLVFNHKKVFIDYKFFDIPNTVKAGVSAAVGVGASYVTVYGSKPILEAAVQARGSSKLKIFAVTELSSSLASLDQVLAKVDLASEAGCDGVIASGADVKAIKAKYPSLLVACPGIRHDQFGVHDHKKTASPKQAISYGADYLIVGRPIVHAKDPVRETLSILSEMEQ